MHVLRLVLTLVVLFLPSHVLADPSYFVINQPAKGTQWVNNQTNYATWTQGRGQGISYFDVELARLGSVGLTYVALNVPASAPSLPLMLQDIPAGDDYYLIFMNSTHGLMYALSSRFSILPAGQSPSNSSSQQQPPSSKQLIATVTVSGAPNPTSKFAYTFVPSSGVRVAGSSAAAAAGGAATALIALAFSLGTVWTW